MGLISGIYFPQWKCKCLFRKFGFIGPNPLIFDGSLISNIQYGNDKSLDEKIVTKYLRIWTFKEEKATT